MSNKTKNGAYKILAAQKDAVTRIAGVIMLEAIDNLKDEIGGIFTILKSTHFNKGQRYGYLACVIPEEKYRLVIGLNTWTYIVPQNPGAYAAAALLAGVSATQCKQLAANHKEEQVSYTKHLGAQEAGKELILYGVGNDALAPLKKQYINFGDATIYSMIKHLQDKTAIKMTTSQKYGYKTEGYRKPWDPTMSITAYFIGLDRFMISLIDRRISTSVKEKTMAAGARMWESEMFTKDQMVTWENKPTTNQTWANLQMYFTEKWLKRRHYLAAMAKQSHFKEAALAAQEQASAEEEEETQAMMFALLQDQHKVQLEVMATANKATMDALMEGMNAMLGNNSGSRRNEWDKQNTPPLTNITPKGDDGNKAQKAKCKKKLCPHCNLFVFHKPDRCYELDANKDKRWAG